jgi:tyrosinase
VNAGAAIASSTVLSASVLSEATYSSNGFDDGFCAKLDSGLHGNVHVGVGDNITGMGAIPWAANDPIFWLHHCNIDRLWASWNAAGGANPTDPQFTSKPFTFADPNGQQTSKIVSSVLDLSSTGYAYDALVGADGAPLSVRTAEERIVTSSRSASSPAPVTAAAPPPVGASAPRMMLRAAPPRLAVTPTVTHVFQNVQLGAGTVRVQLANAAAAPVAAAAALAPALKTAPRFLKRPLPSKPGQPAPLMAAAPPPPKVGASAPAPLIPAPKPGQKVFVVLDDLTTEIQPGVIYSIYLEAPRSSGAPQPFLIGSLNFFSAMPSMGGMRMGHRARSFDITALATQLAAQGRLQANPAITFVPIGKPATSAAPLIGSVSVAIQ